VRLGAALVARRVAHHRAAPETAVTSALDIAVLVCLTGFLYWSAGRPAGDGAAQASLALRLSRSSGRWSAWRPSRVWPGRLRCGGKSRERRYKRMALA